MQEDMHYYGTYAIARAAGLEPKYAKVIAYAAQYVDDSTANDSEVHVDGGMFQTVATAHTNREAIENAVADHIEQRKVWVPFHFYPGNEGKTLSQRLQCTKDGKLAQEMVKHHVDHAASRLDEYGLALMGIMAHVYTDTFSHYGFSGVSSSLNKVDGESFKLTVKDPAVKAYIMGKMSGFMSKYLPKFLIDNWRKVASKGASFATGALGHGAVGTYPDRPFLRWEFDYIAPPRPSKLRNNQVTFLQACEKLHKAFSDFAEQAGIRKDAKEFADIKKSVAQILAKEARMEGRIDAWIESMRDGDLFKFLKEEDNEALHYSSHFWEQQKHHFEHLEHSNEMIKKPVYQFHQAAIFHRDYTLKQLLPKHNILVL